MLSKIITWDMLTMGMVTRGVSHKNQRVMRHKSVPCPSKGGRGWEKPTMERMIFLKLERFNKKGGGGLGTPIKPL